MSAIVTTQRHSIVVGGRPWNSFLVETATHIAQTSLPVYSQSEFMRGMARGTEILGIRIKPHVRVKMGKL